MSTLYRTPNLTLPGTPDIEWHCSVQFRSGRPRRYYRFRERGGMWQPISKWPGHPPKLGDLGKAFAKFRLHLLRAMEAVQ